MGGEEFDRGLFQQQMNQPPPRGLTVNQLSADQREAAAAHLRNEAGKAFWAAQTADLPADRAHILLQFAAASTAQAQRIDRLSELRGRRH